MQPMKLRRFAIFLADSAAPGMVLTYSLQKVMNMTVAEKKVLEIKVVRMFSDTLLRIV